MEYFITFLEGFISFISPCMLPMLPVYISYFAGGHDKEGKNRTLLNALFFFIGFTLVFTALGLFAGSIGSLLVKYQIYVNIITGIIVMLLGLGFLGVFKLDFLKGMKPAHRKSGLFSSLLFGIVFSISLSPCTGAFLGSALMMASKSASALYGTFLLLTYSLGLGLPLLISAVLISRLTTAFNFIKKHYSIINTVSGVFLIIVGILMITGLFDYMLSLFV